MRQKISQYIDEEFVEGSKPDPRTVRAWIADGKIEGEFWMGRWWVTKDASTGNPIADRILGKL